jgi:alpha-beta hydrolase superfamily lysophospholipase
MRASTTSDAVARDGTRIRLRHWPADATPWADVVVVHGLAEHSGRYEDVGRWLSSAGIEVTGYDLRGFGGSAGRRAWVDRWGQHLDDLEDRVTAIRDAARGRPVVVYGHSLGGLVALGYAVADPPRPLPDALVLSAPALDSTIPAWKQRVAAILSRVAPTVSLANAFDGAILSRDPGVAEGYLADPLNHHRTTTRFGAEAFREQARVRAALDHLSIPTLVYHGEADRLVPAISSEPVGRLPTVTRRTYPGLRHESHNEPEGEAVIADVVAWLRSVLDSDHN